MLPDESIKTFKEFWPYYLNEHRHPGNRALHYLGTMLAIIFVAVGLGRQAWWGVAAAPLVAYSCAWSGHFFIEKNRPATFKYPFWSLVADFKMLGLFLIGRLFSPER